MRITVPIVLLLLTGISGSSISLQTVPGCKPVFEKIDHSRYLPHSFYDQAVSSLPELYPDLEILASRRLSRLGDVAYSLIAYKKNPSDSTVRIEGVAEHYPDAWRFSATCPADSTIEGIIAILEKTVSLEWQ